MKSLYFFLLLFFTAYLSNGQGFAPVGAEWHYDEHFVFSGDVDYIKITSEKDTMIAGELCRKITKRHKIICNDRPYTEYLFSRNDTVFFLDTAFNQFQILYIFSANAGDSWSIKVRNEELQQTDSVFVVVDSVSTKQINGINLRALHVTYNHPFPEFPYIFINHCRKNWRYSLSV